MGAAALDLERDYVEIALLYIEDVLEDRQTACLYTRQACRRQLEDLRRAAAGDPAFPYRFDVAKAVRVCRFIERLPHIKGEWAKRRELIHLEPWQVFVLTTLFGWVHEETGLRRFSTLYLEVARKNAKSTLAAGILLYLLGPDEEAGAEVYCAATKKDQARVVFDVARDMARRSPDLRAHYGLTVQTYKLAIPADNREARALDAKGSTQDGLNPHGVINDELHAWKGRALFEVLETAMGARSQPLMVNITTAGVNRDGVCYEQRAYLIRVLAGKTTDEAVFGVIYTLDTEDDWQDETTWAKANPNLGVSVSWDNLRQSARQAAAVASKVVGFLTKRLNVWCNAATAWMDMRRWDAAADASLTLADFAGETAIAALDLATRKDVVSRVLWFERDGKRYLFARHYVPKARLTSGDQAGAGGGEIHAQYEGWHAEGWLTATEGNVTDQERVKADLLADQKAHGLRLKEVVFDRFQGGKMMAELGDAGLTVVDLPNTVAHMSEPMKELEALVLDGKIVHQGDPVLTWMIGNVCCRLDEKENIFPVKETKDSPQKIDGAVAAIMGLNRVLALWGERPSVYENRGLIVV